MGSHAERLTAPHSTSPGADRVACGRPGEHSPASAAQLFTRDTCAVRRARRFVARTLDDWGVTERAGDVVLCAAELAANACEHTRPGAEQFLVRVLLCEGAVRVEVHDRDPRRPEPGNPDAGTPSGRGLIIVNDLADGYGVDDKPAHGKAVWDRFAMTGHENVQPSRATPRRRR
ncbi:MULTISPECIES: ATP-binding protein [unclassified Streptomyces]|uniref:ATP-binding protein n=1 Tax=unclassified Streptomyces TaxID=2593676 RepID=UPI00382AF039